MESITLDLARYEQIRNWEKEKRDVTQLENDKVAIQSAYDSLKEKYEEIEKGGIILQAVNHWNDWRLIGNERALKLVKNDYEDKMKELNKIKERFHQLQMDNLYKNDLVEKLREEVKQCNSAKVPKWIRKMFI